MWCPFYTELPARSARSKLSVLGMRQLSCEVHPRDEGNYNVTNPLMTLSEHLASTVEQAGRSIVAIHARARFNSSGVHWSPGVVVTADHTIRKDDDIHVSTPDGSTHTAELAGRDPSTDLAVLRVKDLNIPVATKAGGSSLKAGKHDPGGGPVQRQRERGLRRTQQRLRPIANLARWTIGPSHQTGCRSPRRRGRRSRGGCRCKADRNCNCGALSGLGVRDSLSPRWTA